VTLTRYSKLALYKSCNNNNNNNNNSLGVDELMINHATDVLKKTLTITICQLFYISIEVTALRKHYEVSDSPA